MSAILTPGQRLDTPGEAYRTGFRDGVTCAAGSIAILIVIFALFGCDDGDRMRRIAEAERNATIAQACVPAADERRVAEWAISKDGTVVLTVTVQKFAGRTRDAVQYVVLNATEIR